ncbi:MAG: hypothetical protein QM644_19810 [Mobilitalea sp.]
MTKTFWIQLDQDNIIRDCVEYEVPGYIEYETAYPLPIGFIGGWFKFENGEVIEIPELKPATAIEEIELTIAELAVDTDFRLSMLELGLV